MANDLSKAFSRDNLKRAWRWILSNTEYKYKNYFRDLYTAYSFSFEENITDLRDRLKNGVYCPQRPVKVYIPKSSGILRPFTLLSIEDQIVYQSMANVVAEYHYKKAKKRYFKTVFGHLYAGKTSKFFYRKWQDSYKLYNKSIIQAYREGYNYIASFDLTACYDSIDHKVLEHFLSRYGLDREFISKLLSFLSCWSNDVEILHGHGIPQGPMASGIIAEVLLSYLDEMFEKKYSTDSIKYFRYVDDVRLLGKDIDSLKKMLVSLDLHSKHIGLFPQSSKIEIHEIKDIETEIKSISFQITDEVNAEKKAQNQNRIIKMIAKLSPQNKVTDLTKFKRYLSFATPNSKLTMKLLKVLENHPYLYESIAIYLNNYPRKIPDKVVDQIINQLNKCEIYQVINGKLLEVIMGKLSTDNTVKVLEFIKYRWKNSNKIKIYDPLYRAMLIAWQFNHGLFKYSEIKHILEKEENWWVLKTIIQYINIEYIGEPSYCELLRILLKNKSVDVAIVAAHEIIKLNIKVAPPYKDFNYIAQHVLKNARVMNRAAKRPSAIGEYLNYICKQNLPQINWKKVFGNLHSEAENKLARAYSYVNTDMSAFINIFDVFLDLLLDRLFEHNQIINRYTIGKIGAVLHQNSPLQKAYPDLWRLCKTIHEKRLECDLSHPKVRNTNKYTRPVEFSYIYKIRPLIYSGLLEFIKKW